MSNVIPLHKEPLTVDEVLGQSQGFSDLVIIGIHTDGKLYINWSGKASVYELIGVMTKAIAHLTGMSDDK